MLEKLNAIDFDKYKDPEIKSVLMTLTSVLEEQYSLIEELRKENQKLRDENNRHKGEDGKPKIKAKVEKKDVSSEKERKKSKKNRHYKSKEIVFDKEPEVYELSQDELPADAVFKEYRETIVQDIVVKKDNVLIKRAVFYSASENKYYTTPYPSNFTGSFGSTLRSYILCLKNICNVTESKIHALLKTMGIQISPAQISNILIKGHDNFHQEKHDIVEAALSESLYHQIDDTGVRFNGQNWYCQVLCNELYTSFETTEKKDRLTVLRILLNGRELKYSLNNFAFALMEKLNLGKKYQTKIREISIDGIGELDFLNILKNMFPTLGPTVKKNILDSAALAWYHTSGDHPVVQILVSDNAKQFKLVSEILALCWVHDGRHYKKLSPALIFNQAKIDTFLTEYWVYYHKLLAYKMSPSEKKAEELSKEFEVLFSRKTGYAALDDRIKKTYAKMEELLIVLEYPSVPLHNNRSELGARIITRIEDVSLHTQTEEGRRARDTFASIIDTAKKLGVNGFNYIYDRISKRYQMKPLADIIKERLSQNEYQDLEIVPT